MTTNRKLPALLTLMLAIIIFAGCTAQKTNSPTDTQLDTDQETGASSVDPDPIDQEIEAGLADPDPIAKMAWEQIRMEYEYKKSNGIYTDVELQRLEHTDSFDDIIEGITIEAYAFDYRIKAKNPQTASLAGSMTIDDDGWVGDSNQHYIYVENNEGELTFITELRPFMEGLGVRGAIIDYYNTMNSED